MIGWKDLRHWWKLRRFVANAWDVMRQRHRKNGEIEVRLRTGRSLYLRCAQQDYIIFDRIFLRDEYHLGEYLGDVRGCVVDIGANVGIFTNRVVDLVDRVVCYEPMPDNFAQLSRNTAGLSHVEIVREAVDGTAGTARIHHPTDASVSGGFTQYPVNNLHHKGSYDEMTSTTLDALFAKHGIERCDLLKIDAEGAEYAVLYGAAPATLARVRRISGEYHNVRPDDPMAHIDVLTARLEKAGFNVKIYAKRGMENHGLFFAVRR